MGRESTEVLDVPLELPLRPLSMVEPDSHWEKLRTVVEGRSPQLRTRFRFVRTQSELALDFAATSTRLSTRHRNRNAPLYEDDVLELFLQAPGAHRYLELELSPAGVLFDAWVSNQTDLKDPHAERSLEVEFNPPAPDRPRGEVLLDGVPPTEFGRDDLAQGLSVQEFRARLVIPLAGFGLTPDRDGIWRANVFRVQQLDSGRREFTAWRPTGRVDFHRPDRFGILRLR